jgi:hypothetical protein
MEDVLHYLEVKNQYYEKFYTVTWKFLEQAHRENWEGLTLFVDNRERILNIIRSFDFKISRRMQELGENEGEIAKYQPKVKSLFEVRNQWVQKIVALDLELITKMEDLKSESIRELKRAMETNQQLSSFSAGRPRKTIKITKDA